MDVASELDLLNSARLRPATHRQLSLEEEMRLRKVEHDAPAQPTLEDVLQRDEEEALSLADFEDEQ